MTDQSKKTPEESEIRNFWDECHQKNDQAHLTGAGIGGITEFLNIKKWLVPGNVVLEIGCGLGICTRELRKVGMRVHALDISPVALDHVRQIVDCTYSTSQFELLPKDTFDLIISNHVTEHIDEETLRAQLKACLPTLKKGCRFAMLVATNNTGYTHLKGVEALKGGCVDYSPEQFRTIVEECGGYIAWQGDIVKGRGIDSYAVHLMRKEI